MTLLSHLRSSSRSRTLRALAGGLFIAAAAAPLKAQALPASSDDSKPFIVWSNTVHAFRDSLVTIARAQVGTKYVHGGQTPESGFDCSGLIRYVMAGLHVPLPRTAAEQATAGVAVRRDPTRLRPGDLLTFGRGPRGVSHIGIYVGNGRFVHASSVAGRVVESDVERPSSSLIRRWSGARRIVASESDSVSGTRGAS